MCTKTHNHITYGSWDIEWEGQNFVILSLFFFFFFPFYPLIISKIKILGKWKKHLEMSSFYTCTKNQDHMMYASWDIVWSMADTIFVIQGHFLPFYPNKTQKNQKFWKNEKNAWKYHFTHVYHKWQSYDWDTEHNRHNFLSFWTKYFQFSIFWI